MAVGGEHLVLGTSSLQTLAQKNLPPSTIRPKGPPGTSLLPGRANCRACWDFSGNRTRSKGQLMPVTGGCEHVTGTAQA